MKQYLIVPASDPRILSEKVEAMMHEGWEPLGGVCYGDDSFFQTMVLNTDSSAVPSDVALKPVGSYGAFWEKEAKEQRAEVARIKKLREGKP